MAEQAVQELSEAPAKEKVFRLPYKPDPEQWEWHSDSSRFRVICAGRRRGKSYFANAEAFFVCRDVWEKEGRPARVWIVAPNYSLVREDWMIAHKLFGRLITDKRKAERSFRLSVFGGPLFEFKSADADDQSLRGAGLDIVVVDEAALVREEAWDLGLRATLADRGTGRAVFISTPRGRNWFYDIWKRGQEGPEHEEGWRSWHSVTHNRPGFPKAEWDLLKKQTPMLAFQQEYEAAFVDNATQVFHDYSECFAGEWEEPQDGEMYVMGVDLARHMDFTVASVWKRSSRHMVHLWRDRQIAWAVQKEKIHELSLKYNNALVVVDATGAGQPIVEDLQRTGLAVRGVQIDQNTRQEIIQRLMIAIQDREVTFPHDPEIAKEMDTFEMKVSRDGRRMRYDHRTGGHDDIIFSMALAAKALGRVALAQMERDTAEKRGTYQSAAHRLESGTLGERIAWLYG